MSVKTHEAFSIDSFMDRLLYWDDFLGDQLQDEWRTAGTGSAVVVDAQTGGIVRITTGATNGNLYSIDWADIRSLHIDKKVTMELRAKMGQLTQFDINFYLFFDADNRVGFYLNSIGAASNWRIFSENNNVATNVDSAILADASYHIFRIECFPADEVHFYIDEVECTNSPITTNIPDDAGDYLQPLLLVRTSEDVTKSMDVDYVVVRQEI